MVLRNRDHVLCAGFLKQLDPLIGIELLGRKHRDKILVTEILVGTIGLNMVFELSAALNVHVAGIPLIGESGNRENSPVYENAEFQVFVYFGNAVLRQRCPGILVTAAGDIVVYFFEIIVFECIIHKRSPE